MLEIRQSATKYLGDKIKAQRLDKVILLFKIRKNIHECQTLIYNISEDIVRSLWRHRANTFQFQNLLINRKLNISIALSLITNGPKVLQQKFLLQKD